MKVVFYLNIVSPHQLPLAREVAKRVGEENFVYIFAEDFHAERARMGWNDAAVGLRVEKLNDGNRRLLEDADVLYTGLRCLDLLERRAERGLKSCYYSERWFKPVEIGVGGRCRCTVDGRVRMFVPRYRKMAKGFVRWLNSDPNARYLAIGPWAKKDMLRLGVKEGKIVDWGYFVEPSSRGCNSPNRTDGESQSSGSAFRRNAPAGEQRPLRVLYIGRLIPLKRVDTIIRAVALAAARDSPSAISTPPRGYTLTVVGDGPEKERLRRLSSTAHPHLSPTPTPTPTPSPCTFLPSVPIAEVRSLMREHDVLVFASNALDGWGAVVSEALEEGMIVLGSNQAGACAALLPDCQRFDCGDYGRLAEILLAVRENPNDPKWKREIGEWSAAGGAERLICAVENAR